MLPSERFVGPALENVPGTLTPDLERSISGVGSLRFHDPAGTSGFLVGMRYRTDGGGEPEKPILISLIRVEERCSPPRSAGHPTAVRLHSCRTHEGGVAGGSSSGTKFARSGKETPLPEASTDPRIIESVGCRPRTAFGPPGAALAVSRG